MRLATLCCYWRCRSVAPSSALAFEMPYASLRGAPVLQVTGVAQNQLAGFCNPTMQGYGQRHWRFLRTQSILRSQSRLRALVKGKCVGLH